MSKRFAVEILQTLPGGEFGVKIAFWKKIIDHFNGIFTLAESRVSDDIAV